ncbi:hypothetical protein HDV06_003428 [Boothiomyces sp. JEL0866]|nr:hypothetical protein HDV06_003380 [Boothiomyces sp. JEL0866]KAJ3325658.1 hypothetical protein HDV06_003428 [Boothiomyces sp. JEL0866]
MGGTQFGILVLSVAVSDLLSGLLWPTTLPFLIIVNGCDNGSIQMPGEEYKALKIALIVLQSAGYFLLFLSLYMALAISMISFYVVVCNGSAKMLNIPKIILASSIIPLIDSVLLFLYVPLSQLDVDHQDRQSYAIPQTLISILPLIGMTYCFIYTMIKLNKMVEFDYQNEKDGTLKIILLKTILALTVSNMAFWYLQIVLFILNNHNNTFVSQLGGFLQSVFGPTKGTPNLIVGALHLIALMFSFDRSFEIEEEIPMSKPKFWGFSQRAPVTINSKSFSESVNSVETNK